MSVDKQGSPTVELDILPATKENLADFNSWLKKNSRNIVAGLTGMAGPLFLLWYSSSAEIIKTVAAHDVRIRAESFQDAGTYFTEVEDIPLSAREASVAFKFKNNGEYEHGSCTGTILAETSQHHIMISERHCFETTDNEPLVDNGTSIWVGSSPNGLFHQTPKAEYIVEEYYPVPNSEIAFVILEATSNQPHPFTPMGEGSLFALDPNKTKSLRGLGYPEVIEGLPMPVNLLVSDITPNSNNTNRIPVESYPFSTTMSGTGLVDEKSRLVALAHGFPQTWHNPFALDKNITISPITQDIIESYNILLSKYQAAG